MSKLSVLTITILLSSAVFAAKPPTEVIIKDQPVEVTGSLTTSITDPVTVNGNVNAAVSGTVNTLYPDGISHHGKPLSDHIQLQATTLPIATAAILTANQILPEGGGAIFTLGSSECLVLTEVDVTYIEKAPGFPTASFRLGLTDQTQSSVSSRRAFSSVPDAGGRGQISKTFPSGLVLKVSDISPDKVYLGLQTFDARVVRFAASGYKTGC